MNVKKKEKDKPLNKAVEQVEVKYQAGFDHAIRKGVAEITKKLIKH